MCLVAGVPIPYENVGSIILEILIRNAIHKFSDDIWIISYLNDAIRMQLNATAAYLKASDKMELYLRLNLKLRILDDKLKKSHELDIAELKACFLEFFELSQQLVSEIHKSMVEIDFGLILITTACIIGICFGKS